MTRRWSIPYLQVVPADGSPPDFTPPSPPGVDNADWQAVWHGEDIFAGQYDWWVMHGGPLVPDTALKAQGRIPVDWTITQEIRRARSVDAPGPPDGSTVPASPVSDSGESSPTPARGDLFQ